MEEHHRSNVRIVASWVKVNVSRRRLSTMGRPETMIREQESTLTKRRIRVGNTEDVLSDSSGCKQTPKLSGTLG